MYDVYLVFCRYTVQTLFMGDPLGTARVGVPLIQHQWRQWWWWRRYIPFLRPAGPAQWRPFSEVDSKLQISLVGKLLFSLHRLWSFGLYIPFLRPAGPAQWRPFPVVDSKLQIRLVGKLLFSLDCLWSFGLYVITSSGLAMFCFSHWFVTKQNIAGPLDGMIMIYM